MADIAEVLSVEEFVRLRRDGLMYEQIAQQIRCSKYKVRMYGRSVLPPELQRAVRFSGTNRGDSILERIAAVDDGSRPAAEVAATAGCSVTVVYTSRRKRGIAAQLSRGELNRMTRQRNSAGARCRVCRTRGWDRNPLLGELCLACRVRRELGLFLYDAVDRFGLARLVQAMEG